MTMDKGARVATARGSSWVYHLEKGTTVRYGSRAAGMRGIQGGKGEGQQGMKIDGHRM